MEPNPFELARQASGLGPLAAVVVLILMVGFMWANLLNEGRQTKSEVKRARRGIARLSRRVRALELERAAEGG